MAHVGQELRLGEGRFLELLIERDQSGVALDELLLALAQGPVGSITLHEVQIGPGVVTDAGHQFDLIGQLDQIIVGAHRESLALDLRVFVRGQDDDGCVFCGRIRAQLADESQPINAGHDEVLQNDRRLDLVG